MSYLRQLAFLPLAATPLAFLTVAACATATRQEAKPAAIGEGGAVCAADRLDPFKGQRATQELGDQILRQSGATRLRWVPLGRMVTMDYRADRVTVRLDGENRMTDLTCG